MKIKVILQTVIGSMLISGTFVCHAAKWEKNDDADAAIASGYYNTHSIKSDDKIVSWTEKYILTTDGISAISTEISKHKKCKENITEKGDVTQMQMDYQIEKKTLKFRTVAKRYYNKADKLICTDKDTGDDFKSNWSPIQRGSSMQRAQFDLVTKYKIKIQ